jgi:predicted ABC-type ATPase
MTRHQALQDRLKFVEAYVALSSSLRLMPLGDQPPGPLRTGEFRHDSADQVSPVLERLLAEVLPGALLLDWRRDAMGHTGRMVADGLVFRFRVDGDGVGYRPAWDDVGQRGWELRSDSFLELRSRSVARMDFRRSRFGTATLKKRQCSTGYSCGNSCISLQRECRISPASAIGKIRLRRLQQLAAAGDKAAEATATQVAASRGTMAAERQKERNTKRVEQLLARPEIAEFLRTGRLPQAAISSTEPGTVREVEPGDIAFDPGRFQYKLNATAGTGEVGSLSGVRRWDPNLAGVMSVWKDPADSKIYVVNGHNRLSLARRLGAESVTVRFLKAANATEARAIGALQNIAEGAGTPMDAAKFFRDTGIKSQADVEARGLPLGSGQAEKGLRLSKLPTEVFNAVVRGDLSVNRGAIIGGSGLDEAKQREVFKMIGSRKAIADQTLQELVEHAAASQQRTQTTMSLFGETQEAKDNLITRAKLSAGLKAKISREKRLFSTVSRARAATALQEKGGNVINQEQSAKVAGEASEALGVFERLKSASGPISSALNRAADRVEAGESEAKVRQELEADVFAAVEQELQALGLRKRPRADADRGDSLQARLDTLKRKCSTGYGCGSSCISLRKECRIRPASEIGKERLKRLLALAAGGASSQRGIAPVKASEAGEMAAAIAARRGQQAGQLRGARAQRKPADRSAEPELDPDEVAYLQVSTKSQFSSDRKTREELARRGVNLGSDPQKRLQQLGKSVREKLLGKDYHADPDYKQKLRRFAKASEAITVTATTASVLSNPGRHDPGLAPRAKQQGLNSQDVATSSQQAAFARQQQQAAQAAGDQRGAQAWRTEERTVERQRLANAIARSQQSQTSLFGVTEYDESMPLFQHPAAATDGTAAKPLKITDVLRETTAQLKAADARQMGMIAEQLFETGWTLDRQTRYKGMSKGQAREAFKVEFAKQLQAQASSPEAIARAAAMRYRAGVSGSVAGALRSITDQMQAQDQRLSELQRRVVDLRLQAEEQLGGTAEEEPALGGARPRRRIGGSRRRDAVTLSLEERIDAVKKKCVTGYPCGASCIPVAKKCRITPVSSISQRRLKRLMDLAARETSIQSQQEKSSTERRIKALNSAKDQLGKTIVASLKQKRADGQGDYIEHPDSMTMRRIKATARLVAKIDRELNVLEGKDPDDKRWIDGDSYGLAKYSSIESPGRKAYERKVIAKELSGAMAGDQAVFMSGGPASGKTSLLKKQFGAADGFVVIDPDRIKDYDPVMAIGVALGMKEAASLAHENSSRLSKEIYATARDRGFNVLMDGTGANADKYIAQMQELKGKGYRVTLLGQHVTEEVGVQRALSRAERTGRYVPLDFIKHAYKVIPGNFERLAQVADRATLNDGVSNETIMHYQAGSLKAGSRARMAAFRNRYGNHQRA